MPHSTAPRLRFQIFRLRRRPVAQPELGPDHSCRAAVKRIAVWMARRGQKIDDEDTGPYCKARARLPESVPFRLMRALGREVHEAAPVEWLWCGRRVKVVDGTT